MRTTEEKRIGGLQKELRTRFYEMGLQVLALHAGNQERVGETMDGICELIGFTKLTSIEEERILFPKLAISAPFMVSLLEQDKEQVIEIGEKLAIHIEQWENSISAREKQRLIRLVQSGFNNWMANLLQYLNRQQLLDTDTGSEEIEQVLVVEAA